MSKFREENGKEAWMRRIILLLRGAEVWQLRELFYMTLGYINASRGAGQGCPEPADGGPESGSCGAHVPQ